MGPGAGPRAATLVLGALLLGGPAQAAEGGLQLIPDLIQLGLLIVLSLLLVVPVNALLFKPVFQVLDQRTERIAGTRRRAERVAEEAERALAEYRKAVSEERERAEQERKARLEEVRQEQAEHGAAVRAEADREVEQARSALGSELTAARATLRAQAELLAREAAERVLGRSLS